MFEVKVIDEYGVDGDTFATEIAALNLALDAYYDNQGDIVMINGVVWTVNQVADRLAHFALLED